MTTQTTEYPALKGYFTQNLNVNVIGNPYDNLSSVEHKNYVLKNVGKPKNVVSINFHCRQI